MGRGGKVVGQRNFKKRVRSNDDDSDDSDEDYVIENEERGSGDESVEYASSVEGYCSSEEEQRKAKGSLVGPKIRRKRSSLVRKRRNMSYGEDDDNGDDDGVNVRANKRSRSKSCLENGTNSSRKRRVVSYEEDKDYVDVEDDDYDEDNDKDDKDDEDDEDYVKVRASKRSKSGLGNGVAGSGKRKKGLYEEDEEEDYVDGVDEEEEDDDFDKRRRRRNNGPLENGKISRKRKDSCEEDEDKDEDYVNVDDGEEEEDDDDYDGEDEELALCEEEEEEEDEEEEEEEVVAKRRSSNVKMSKKKKSKRRRTNSRVVKRPAAKKNGRLRKKVRYQEDDDDEEEDVDFIDCNLPAREKTKKPSRRRRKSTVNSDSDFVASGSECEYTVSEEEREQVKEAKRLFGGGLRTNLRSSSSADNEDSSLVARKGKEKVKESKPETAKQVCGICFTEEEKRRLRGTLDCCSHYFCFKCIMEWSKVESRCPLCKQRFTTITKNGRLSGMDLRSEVIEVPKRDQVLICFQITET
ncbi:E3 ubiquitin-protein ligase Topors [Linum grandiflorum]